MANLVKAEFKTAYLQREMVMDMKLASSTQAASSDGLIPLNGYKVGEIVYASAADTLSPRSTIASVAVGDYIIAQSDQTLQYNGHIPVENRDYRYSPAVASSATAAKKLALFKIINLDDVKLTLVTAH